MKKPLSGKRIAVAGFNARPLACSLKIAGAQVYVSDYWGDEDLSSCCHRWVSVLNARPDQRHRTDLEEPVHRSLAQNLINNFDCSKMDYVIVGSSFDDHPESLKIIEEACPLTGNSSDLLLRARDSSKVAKLAKQMDLLTPERHSVTSLEEALKSAEQVGYPCLIRPHKSGGGAGIRLVRNSDLMEDIGGHILASEGQLSRVIEQYIPGLDISCSVLGTGDDAVALSLQGQLIGLPSAGRNCDFIYCGNYLPPALDKETTEHLRSACAHLCAELGLLGSNGIDLVIDYVGAGWLMEVNPRIQGTIEMLEASSDINVSHMHISACEGMLPDRIPTYLPAVKMIVYSRRGGTLPDLSQWKGTHDRSPKGVRVKRGDPICTIVESSTSLPECYSLVCKRAASIQASVR